MPLLNDFTYAPMDERLFSEFGYSASYIRKEFDSGMKMKGEVGMSILLFQGKRNIFVVITT